MSDDFKPGGPIETSRYEVKRKVGPGTVNMYGGLASIAYHDDDGVFHPAVDNPPRPEPRFLYSIVERATQRVVFGWSLGNATHFVSGPQPGCGVSASDESIIESVLGDQSIFS